MKQLSVKQAAKLLNLTERSLRQRIFHKTIPYFKVGSKVRLDGDVISRLALGGQGESKIKRSYNKKSNTITGGTASPQTDAMTAIERIVLKNFIERHLNG